MLLCCAPSCPTLCRPMDCSLPGSSAHIIFQARILEWAAISYSSGSFWPRDQTYISCISCVSCRWIITSTTWETHRDSRLLQTKSRMGSGMGLLHACDLSLVIGDSVIYFGHLMQRTDSFGKDPDAGKDWRREEKGMTEDEIVGWHHQLNGHEFE